MSARELHAAPRAAAAPPVRRIRHEARDSLTAAAFSLVASLGVTAAVWGLLWWWV
jgi:hypothetical protein